MKKIVIRRPGDYKRLEIEDQNISEPEDNEVLIRTSFIGINYADVLIRWGVYSSAKEYVGWPITPGFELSGTVEKVGKDVSQFNIGDEVFGITRFGAYATKICLDERMVFKKPSHLSLEQAAAFPAVYLTAYHALFQNVIIRKDAKVMVHSAAGGVGSAVLQMCKLKGFETTAIVGSSHKIGVAKNLGADHIIDKSSQDLWKEVEKIHPEGYDIILDANGAETLQKSFDHLAPTGKLLCYGFASMLPKTGGKLDYFKLIKTYIQTPRFNPLEMTTKNRSLITFNLSYLFDKMDIFKEAMDEIVQWIEADKIKGPQVTAYPFDKVGEAHMALESGKTTGKIVLKCT